MKNILDYSMVSESIIVFIDMQEKLVNAMPEDIAFTMSRQQKLLNSAVHLNLPVIITEQYPRGLGNTVHSLKECFSSDWAVVEKNTFSCMGSDEFKDKLKDSGKKSVVICGIETHVCVLQTALDCIRAGYRVIVLRDAVCSRNCIDRETAFLTMENAGVFFMTVESFLFMILEDSKHPEFKKISKILASAD